MPMSERSFLGLSAAGFHRVAYTQWGRDDAARTVVCVHGLTRNGRDFDHLALALADRRRVACPDVVGRGRSGWLPVPSLYGYPQYCADMAGLIARLGVEEVDWVGTSMGGLIGMTLAAQPNSPIRRLVINDVGPFIAKAGLQRIADYVGKDPVFEDLPAVESYLRFVLMGFGRLSDACWRHMAEHSARRRPDGRYGLAYDPGIAEAFKNQPMNDVDLWALWDRIQCPVLVLRGADSDLLTAGTAEEMTRRGPGAGPGVRVVEFAHTGHAPALMSEDQIAVVRDFLLDA
ncbi:alpha/beta fold hydrolase [Azospirillum agricola]|uniref:alpha/beta fold hydrolase n=1 Tax=Azospirillum agricola TaxID=1720247 RepID=UPI000A0F1B80|nr:alpha/beta hydrolase [Azospirillum agricola]SMH60004.1 Pimeloyl-ACP methyl ester carboxylesterase [Azospirillum lipoferum]